MKDTTGLKLKRTLGLENIRYVSISRVLISAYKVYYVFYDTRRATTPITNQRALRGYMPSALQQYPFANRPSTTPLIDIEDYNGTLRSAMFFAVDLAGQYADQKKLTHVLEGKENKMSPYFFGSLKEYVTIADLMDTGNISDVTKKFRKDRSSKLGAENKTAKLVDVFIDQGDDSVTYVFSTKATPYENPDHEYGEVNPSTFNISKNLSKQYIIHIKILEFFSWLSTHPDKETITRDDIKEILEVSNVQIWSNSPSFMYQGFNYWLNQLDGSIHGTNISPKRWDKIHGDGQAVLDKHTYGLLRQMAFFEFPMAQILGKKLKQQGLL